jgi:two-component system chemotaxis response regulator CheB
MSKPSPALVVAGASAGGVEALVAFVRELPSDPPFAVVVVLHVAPAGTSALSAILQRQSTLDVALAQEGETLRPGVVRVAPPDHHLLVRAGGVVELNRGPRVNGFRPAIDPTMRSAAEALGPEVTGIVLSGTRDDGTAGLAAIKAAGGCAIVQDPEEALYDGMPKAAINGVAVDAVLPVAVIAAHLADPQPLSEVEVSTMAADQPTADSPEMEPDGTRLTCPDCGGVLIAHEAAGSVLTYACSVGHSYSPESLAETQEHTVENALWTAVRSLEDRAALLEGMALRAEAAAHRRSAESFRREARDCREKAHTIRVACGFPPQTS